MREYPDYVPPSPPTGYVPAPLAPEIVAYGDVLAGTTSPALDSDDHTGSPDPADKITFGVIGAWDGHRVAKGRVVVDSTWHHFQHQLAEQYLNKARGACSVLIIDKIMYKPKIPWWEWVQEIVDIWDPVRKLRERGRGERQQLLGAQGVGPRVEVAATLGLGAAAVTAAFMRHELLGNDIGRALRAVDARWNEVFAHAVSTYDRSLAQGAELQDAIRQVVAAQTKATG